MAGATSPPRPYPRADPPNDVLHSACQWITRASNRLSVLTTQGNSAIRHILDAESHGRRQSRPDKALDSEVSFAVQWPRVPPTEHISNKRHGACYPSEPVAPLEMNRNQSIFHDREDTAFRLAVTLRDYEFKDPLVSAILRGVLSRKLCAPNRPEFTIGAISETGEVYLNAGRARSGRRFQA
jgi:hypothetical protein